MQVLTLFEQVGMVDEELKNQIALFSEVIQIKKKERLLEIGDTSKYIYFIYKGAIWSYHMNNQGNEVTSWLLFEGEIVISVYSFFSQKPSFEGLQALEDCVLLRLRFEKLQELYQSFPTFNYIGRVLTEQYYIRSEEKAASLRILSAKERYNQLLKLHPHILQRVSLGYIASYLGVTQYTLSRIRATI